MRQVLRYTVLGALLPLAIACAGDEQGGGPDWSSAQLYNVTTGKGDRATIRVLGDAQAGYEYRARIRHTTRSDPDPLDRQRVLESVSRTVAAKVCTKGSKHQRLQFSPDNYEAYGHFDCTAK